MGVIYSSVDAEGYTPEKNGTLTLSGWRSSEDVGTIEMICLADETEISTVEISNHKREDVFQICKTLSKEDSKVGFELTMTELNPLIEQHQNIRVVCRQEKKEKTVWEKTTAELKKEVGERTLIRKIDDIRRRGSQMVVSGWIIDYLQENRIKVQDCHGKPMPYEIKQMARPDVCKAYNLTDIKAFGFEVAVARKDLKNQMFTVCFENEITVKETTIDVKKYDFENSPRGRMMQTLSLSRRKENRKIIREKGFSYFVKFVQNQMDVEQDDYETWLKMHQPNAKELKKQRKTKFVYEPKISIVIPLFNTPIRYLDELLVSIASQTYANWELCLADGSTKKEVGDFIRQKYGKEKRIRYQKLEENNGIAGNTNAAVAMATGDYVMLCDHDDLVAVDALYEMVSVLNEDSSTDIIYTDEDKVNSDTTMYFSPNFKPDFNFDFLRSINYICHIFTVRKTILDEVGGFRENFDGAQDFDFILRCCEKTTKIAHIPKILYHWRSHENSTAGNPDSKQYAIDAGKRALEEHYARLGIDAEVRYTGIFIMFESVLKVKDNPKVSILIPSKDHVEDLDKCITSIEEKSTWKNFEIIVIENNSTEQDTFAYYDQIQLRYPNVQVVYWKKGFNYSAINNYGASFATGDYYVLMNNDIEVITPQWMEYMLGYCQRENTGIVGAKLYYPDDTVQHCGVVIGMGGFAGHILTRTERKDSEHSGRLKAIQDISAVTAACLMIKKTTFDAIGGLDEEFQVALNDVDLCLKVRAHGELVVENPMVEMYHYESKSRGMEDSKEKHERFKREIARFRTKWADILEKGDPYYNPNLTLMYDDCRIRGKHEHFDIIDEIEGGH